MTERRPGRDSDDERARITAAVEGYLARARRDPSLPLSYEAIAKDTKVSRNHFARAEYESLVQQIVNLRRTRARGHEETAAPRGDAPAPAGPVSRDAGGQREPGDLRALGEADLAARLRHHASETGRIMQVWLGHHRRGGAPADAPLVLHDLDRALGALHAQAEALRTLVAEQHRRAGAAPPPPPAAGAPEQLALAPSL